jgi:hypothetical protein
MNYENALFLLENKKYYNLSEVDGNSDTVLHLAIKMGSSEVFQRIIAVVLEEVNNGLDVSLLMNMRNKQLNNVMHEAELNRRNMYV